SGPRITSGSFERRAALRAAARLHSDHAKFGWFRLFGSAAARSAARLAPTHTSLDTSPRICYQAAVRSELLKDVSRIVVKLGTGVLTDSRKQLDPAQLEQIVAQVAALRATGKEVVVVTSGAVGAGMGALGYDARPANLAEKQACAAV